jgi:hypothetical protein
MPDSNSVENDASNFIRDMIAADIKSGKTKKVKPKRLSRGFRRNRTVTCTSAMPNQSA